MERLYQIALDYENDPDGRNKKSIRIDTADIIAIGVLILAIGAVIVAVIIALGFVCGKVQAKDATTIILSALGVRPSWESSQHWYEKRGTIGGTRGRI